MVQNIHVVRWKLLMVTPLCNKKGCMLYDKMDDQLMSLSHLQKVFCRGYSSCGRNISSLKKTKENCRNWNTTLSSLPILKAPAQSVLLCFPLKSLSIVISIVKIYLSTSKQPFCGFFVKGNRFTTPLHFSSCCRETVSGLFKCSWFCLVQPRWKLHQLVLQIKKNKLVLQPQKTRNLNQVRQTYNTVKLY